MKRNNSLSEQNWDRKLHVRTCGRDEFDADDNYYPSDEFVSCMMTEPDLVFEDEIDCQDLFDGDNPRERILIFEMKML